MLKAMKTAIRLRVPMLSLLLVAVTAASAPPVSPVPAGVRRAELVADWRGQGLQASPTRNLDLVYVRPGARIRGDSVLQLLPVQVQLRADWQRANRELERMRVRPAEEQRLKDEVAVIVAEELRKQLGELKAGGGTPVLQARVLDLYLNAPDIQTASNTRNYTRSFGDMVLVAELREAPGGSLLLGSWEHRPAREFSTLRLTTRVENAIEVRSAARAWARQLRRELDRLSAEG